MWCPERALLQALPTLTVAIADGKGQVRALFDAFFSNTQTLAQAISPPPRCGEVWRGLQLIFLMRNRTKTHLP